MYHAAYACTSLHIYANMSTYTQHSAYMCMNTNLPRFGLDLLSETITLTRIRNEDHGQGVAAGGVQEPEACRSPRAFKA